MAYIKSFEFDIFISYSHVDNLTITSQNKGWIIQFYENLRILLDQRIGRMGSVKIWWDNKKLDGSIKFENSIKEGINNSAIFISLMSPGYLASDYCLKELDLFYTKSKLERIGINVEDHSRIFNVLLNNINRNTWPDKLAGMTGFPFYDSVDYDDMGDPIEIGSHGYKKEMQDLRDAIITLMTLMRKDQNELISKAVQEKTELLDNFSIYFGEVSDTLRSTKKRVKNELEKKGFQILDDIPPPFEFSAHDKLVREKLSSVDLSIHLLDKYPGREIENTNNTWYSKKQSELALDICKSKLIWIPEDLNAIDIEEEEYKHYIMSLEDGKSNKSTYEFIRGSKSLLTQDIVDMADQLKVKFNPKSHNQNISVLIDTHFNDQIYAFEFGKSLIENQIQPFINPQEDDPHKNIDILSERIRQVTKLIFFYGQVSKDWVLERMSTALQLIVTNNIPIEEFYLIMVPPKKNINDILLRQRVLNINIINNSETPKIKVETVNLFLESLRISIP